MRKKYKLILFSTGIILILTLFIGTSYSLWKTTNLQDNVNVVSTKCFNVEITSEKNSIALENAYPITNEKGKKLTPYSFTITNTCDVFASYQVNLESLKSTTLASKFLDVMINNEEIKKLSEYESTDTINTGSIESHILAKGSLGSGDSVDYTLRLWIDYDTTMEDLDNETKSLKSKVVVISQPSNWSPVSSGYDTLREAILANEYQTSPETAIKKIEAKGTPDLSKTAPLIEWEENVDTNISTVTMTRFAESAINVDENTSNLNINHTLLKIGTSYIFNKSSGIFSKKDVKYLDPLNLDYSNDYYITNDIPTWTTINGTKYYTISNYGDRNYVYKIIGVKAENIKNGLFNKYDAIKYTLTVKKISALEKENTNSDKGLYYSTDNFGKTYYYRGNINNNYVIFGDFFWRIVRINGDGSVRLMFSHTFDSKKASIGKSKYNNIDNSPAYGGYAFGSDISTRENAIKNEVNSTVKEFVDNWYLDNIQKNSLNIYINDSGFCNNRELSSGDGYSTNKGSSFGIYSDNNKAKFYCSNNNDLFSLKNANFGNNYLTYPIGLITIDELIFSGNAIGYFNKYSWTFSGNNYLTMSPSIFDSYYTVVDVWTYQENGGLSRNYMVSLSADVRPVINLKADVKITGGIGTINDPYIVKTE